MMKKVLMLLMINLYTFRTVQGQQADSSHHPFHFSGSVSVTHNGLSFIPTFSLEKPAAVFNLSMGRKVRFEPELRFGLDGKPWSFLFWWRYSLLNTGKFSLRLGAHPAMNFKSQTVTLNGVPQKAIITRRYVAGELAPVYTISKKLSTGVYYLYSRGLDPGTAKNNHFLAYSLSVSHLRLLRDWYLKVTPQVYYLKLDQQDGYFVTSSFAIAKPGFPFSLGAIINKRVQAAIAGSRDFVWNTTLVYSFSRK
jgi:hypothetical protein